METALVAVRDTDEYKLLLDKSWDYVGQLKLKGYELVILRWQWGYDLAGVDIKYGDSFIDSLADDIGWDRSTLFRTRALGKAFDSKDDLKKYWDDCERSGISMNLTRLLQSTAPDPTQRPGNYGGKTQVVDDLMRQVETLAIKKEKLREFLNAPELSPGKKQEIMGVLEQVEEVAVAAALPDTKVGRSEDYLDYIRSLPCCLCSFHPVDSHHTDTGGTGMKGSDFSCIPLCRKCHDELGSGGKESFQTLHGIRLDTEVKRVLVKWCDAREADQDD